MQSLYAHTSHHLWPSLYAFSHAYNPVTLCKNIAYIGIATIYYCRYSHLLTSLLTVTSLLRLTQKAGCASIFFTTSLAWDSSSNSHGRRFAPTRRVKSGSKSAAATAVSTSSHWFLSHSWNGMRKYYILWHMQHSSKKWKKGSLIHTMQ